MAESLRFVTLLLDPLRRRQHDPAPKRQRLRTLRPSSPPLEHFALLLSTTSHAATTSPQCRASAPTSALIGLNRGRPFTTNPCFASEWAAAQPPRSVYINTAYSPTLFRQITPDCSNAGRSQPLRPAAQRAYAVGCSEAAATLQLLAATSPLGIWLDVEPGNMWSSKRSLNAATIKGILDHLLTHSPHPVIGVYSNASFWRQIAGGWTSLSAPEWVATGVPDPPGCPSGFAAGPVWLSQSTNGRLDVDTVC